MLTAVLWIVTGQAADLVHARYTYVVHSAVVRTVLPHPTGLVLGGEPPTGSTVLTAVLAGAVAAVVVLLAVRRLPRATGRWAAFLASWFAVVVASAVAGTAHWFASVPFPSSPDVAHSLVLSLTDGYWGLANGWVVGLAVVVTLASTDRRDEPLPSRHARALPPSRAVPAVLAAGLSATVLWAAVGALAVVLPRGAGTSGAGDAVHAVLLPSAMMVGPRPLDVLARPVELVLAVGVGLVVACLAALVTFRLPRSTGRCALVLSVWFACVVASVLAAAARRVVDRVEVFGGLHPADLAQILPFVEAALAWGLAYGWVVGLVAMLAHQRIMRPDAAPAPAWPDASNPTPVASTDSDSDSDSDETVAVRRGDETAEARPSEDPVRA